MLNVKTYLKQDINKLIIAAFAVSMVLAAVLFFPATHRLIISAAESFLHRELTVDLAWVSSSLWQMGLLAEICLIFFCFLYMLKAEIKQANVKLYSKIFCAVVLFGFVCSNIYIIQSKTFEGYDNVWEFSDFTSSIQDYGHRTNLYGTNYPPLAVLFFKFLLCFLPQTGYDTSYAINYLLNLYIMFSVLAMFILFFKLFKDMGGVQPGSVRCIA